MLRKPDAAIGKSMVMAATRCRECHEKMYGEWKHSVHARSARSPWYAKARAGAGTAEQCDRCHVPLRSRVRADNRAIPEGVTCDVCHMVKTVTIGKTASQYQLRATDAVKYGPFCDAKDHYFHRMGCAPSQTDGTLCAGCHHLTIRTKAGVALPIYTTYADWRAGPSAADGMMCQHCHMPASRAEAATGSGERPRVRHHGFMGKTGKLRRRAVSLSIELTEQRDKLVVKVDVKNSGAGHYIPSGLPARRIVAVVRTLDAKGRQVDRYEHMFGRVLVDAAGKQVPYYLAAKLLEDSRIPPRKSRRFRCKLSPGRSGSVHVAVLWRAFAKPIAAALDAGRMKDLVMIETRIPFGARGKRGLPTKPVIVKP